MSKHQTVLIAAAAAALAGVVSVAHADPALPDSAPVPTDFTPKHQGLWMVNVRVTDVIPTDGQSILTAAGAGTGLKTDIASSVVPTLGISYFLTDHVAAELILGTSYHSISAAPGGAAAPAPAAGAVAEDPVVRRTWVLPPTLSLQYHFMPQARFSPYVGAGVNYMLFYGGQNVNGYSVKLPSGFGASLEIGGDYAISRHISLNADLKKIFFTTDASIDGGALKSNVRLDPWVPSIGAGYRF